MGDNDRVSIGAVLCFDPTSNSDVRHYNLRFGDNLESNMGDKVWKDMLDDRLRSGGG